MSTSDKPKSGKPGSPRQQDNLGGMSMIVVTGPTGHIGNVLVRELLERGERVRGLVLPGEDLTPIRGLDMETVEGDILDLDSLVRAFEGADVVYHLAGMISIVPGEWDRLYKVNVEGTRNVIRACFICGVKRLVYASSIHAFAEPSPGVVFDETSPFDPDRLSMEYDRSKAMATLEVLEAVTQGLDAVVVCPTGVMGPYDYRLSEMGRLIRDFSRKTLIGYVNGAYDFVDVRDVAKGLILACERGKRGESYILSGERITIPEIMSVLEELTGSPRPRLKFPVWLAEIAAAILTPLYLMVTRKRPLLTTSSIQTLQRNSETTSQKAISELGYSARPLRQSIEDSIKWLKDHGIVS
jgi:dihydroflavonol-4-reductase